MSVLEDENRKRREGGGIMANDVTNGAGLLIKRWEDVKNGKIKVNSVEYKRLQIDTTIYSLENLVITRSEIDKLKRDNWVGVIKEHPRFTASVVVIYNALLIRDIRHPFLNWLSALIIQLFGL